MSTHRNQKTQLAISSNRPYASPPKGFLSGWVQRHLVASHWGQWTLPPYTTQPAMQQQIHPLYPHHHGQDDGNTNETQTDLSTDSNIFFMSCSNPDKTPLKSTEVAQMAIQDSHLKVENSKWWPMGNWWFISSCSRSRWTSQVGNSKTSSSFDGDQQPRNNEHYLHMWVLYKKNGPTGAKKPSLAQLDQIKMAQMAIITIRIQHCALAQKGLQTRNGDQFVSFCLPFFYPNLWNLIWRWPTWTGHRRPQTRHNEHQLHVANSSSWPSSCKSCVKKIDPTGAKKPSMPDKQHQIGSHGH